MNLFKYVLYYGRLKKAMRGGRKGEIILFILVELALREKRFMVANNSLGILCDHS